VSLWDVPVGSAEALTAWLTENLGGDTTSQVSEVEEVSFVFVFRALLLWRARAQPIMFEALTHTLPSYTHYNNAQEFTFGLAFELARVRASEKVWL
jgi:hypothetical protein